MPSKHGSDWSIRNIDTDELFIPPYDISPDGIKISYGGEYVDIQRFGTSPVSNWVGTKAQTIQFSSAFFAETEDDDITKKFYALVRMTHTSKDLGRPPICNFEYGAFNLICQLENVDVVIDGIMDESIYAPGNPRHITVDITLREYVQFSRTQINPKSLAKESYYLVVSSLEASYEQIAKRFYGSAMAGDRLRKRHPHMPMQPIVGSKVDVPSRSIILKEVVQPDYHAFSFTDMDATESFRLLVDRRSLRKVVI